MVRIHDVCVISLRIAGRRWSTQCGPPAQLMADSCAWHIILAAAKMCLRWVSRGPPGINYQPAGLQDDYFAVPRQAMIEDDLRNLGGLSGAGGRLENHAGMGAQGRR